MDLRFPLELADDGRLAEADADRHLRDMMEQVLFTRPGERINRPNFGCGIQDLVFAPIDSDVVGQVSQLVATQMRKWLDDVVEIQGVDVDASGTERSVLSIVLRFRPLAQQQTQQTTFVYQP